MPDALTDDQLAEALTELPHWSGDVRGLRRTVELADFPTAIAVVDAVAAAAERQDHHPDIDIRWRTVSFACVTHSVGGVTEADLALARAIESIVGPAPRP